ncbi:MAG: hypothetical protein JXI43_04730 [Tissierellales bacterium]|nr:hypothetical protein [Tissierellales bacterium]
MMDHSNEALVTQFKESGLTQETFCKNNGIPLERLRYHLYKKNRIKSRTTNRIRKQEKSHSFISFQQPAQCLPPKDTASKYTIVYGAFTYKQLAELIRELGGSVC